MNLNRINVGMLYVAGKATYEEYQESTMANTERADSIRAMLAEHISVPSVTDNQRLEIDLGMDSLDIVELTMVAEEQFGIDLTDADMDRVKTVWDAVKLIEEAIGKGQK